MREQSEEVSYSFNGVSLAGDCPNDFIGTGTLRARGKGNPPQGAQLGKIMEKGLDRLDPELEKKAKCGDHTCAEGACTYDSRLIGTPAVTTIPAGQTHKHHIPVPAEWTATQEVQYGCFCLKTI